VRLADDAYPVLSRGPRQPPAADVIYDSMAEMHQKLISVIPGGRFLSQNGAFAFVTGIPRPALNGVWFKQANPEMTAAIALLDGVARTLMPFSLRLRPGAAEQFAQLAAARKMEREDDLVLMAIDLTASSSLAATPLPRGFAIRRLPPEQAMLHATVLAAAHAVDADVVRRALSRDLLRPAAVRCYVGEMDGEPVSTALSVTLGPLAGIYNVATAPAAGGFGFASAVTARALAGSRVAGADWCWIEATAPRVPMFTKLGFHAVESQQYWASAS
jgi:N-acetylglutamate synthase